MSASGLWNGEISKNEKIRSILFCFSILEEYFTICKQGVISSHPDRENLYPNVSDFQIYNLFNDGPQLHSSIPINHNSPEPQSSFHPLPSNPNRHAQPIGRITSHLRTSRFANFSPSTSSTPGRSLLAHVEGNHRHPKLNESKPKEPNQIFLPFLGRLLSPSRASITFCFSNGILRRKTTRLDLAMRCSVCLMVQGKLAVWLSRRE